MIPALLTTKLHLPTAGSILVPRPRLTERLSIALACKLTLVTAPAGFGKTTAVSAWLDKGAEAGEVYPFVLRLPHAAWVSLDAGDNDPAQFWSYVVAAWRMLLPELDQALPLLSEAQAPIETFLTHMLNALATLEDHSVLVLDDYHVITTPVIHHALAFLLDWMPPRVHLVLTSRVEPPLPLARLRARGQLNELYAADLRFTSEEAATFLQNVCRLPLHTDVVAALEARTEGWIAGLQLAALAMRDRRDLAGFVAAFTGSNRFVMDYLVEEVFASQTPHIQRFLLQTALLDRMCGPLCDAMLGVTTCHVEPIRSAQGKLRRNISLSSHCDSLRYFPPFSMTWRFDTEECECEMAVGPRASRLR